MAMCKVSTSAHFVQITQRSSPNGAHWVPNTDVYATDEGLVVKLELAGMRSENLQITVEGNKLRITGQRAGRLPRGEVQLSGHGDQLRAV